MIVSEDELFVIFSFLEPKEIIKISLTCKLFYQISFHPLLWKDVSKNIKNERNIQDNRLLYILQQSPYNRKSLIIHFISMFQSIFKTKTFNNLSREQVKEILKEVGVYCFKIPPESSYKSDRDYKSPYPYQTCESSTWNYQFGWFSNNCELKVEHYYYEDDGYNIECEILNEYSLKLENWKFEFKSSQKDVKSFGTRFNEIFALLMKSFSTEWKD